MDELKRNISYVKRDAAGNTMQAAVYSLNGVPQVCVFTLKFSSELRTRNLGYITIDDGTLHVKRSRAKHLHNASRSYGFNYEVLTNDLFAVKQVHLTEDISAEYVFPTHMIKEYGSFLHFKEQGFELQRFLPLDLIVALKVEQYTGAVLSQ